MQIGLPEAASRRWQLERVDLIADTFTSRVYRVATPSGGRIVKQLKPEGVRERIGMAYLDWRAGDGTVRLIDKVGDCHLLEDAGSMSLAHHLRIHGDEAATEIICELISRLHKANYRPAPSELTPLGRHFAALFSEAGRSHPPEMAEFLARAARLAETLLDQQDCPQPLHGDLHHDNVIGSGDGTWRAIDPQGLIGDPVYEVANVFGNPDDETALVLAPERALRLARRFAAHFGCSPAKVLRHAVAHAALSVSWSLAQASSPRADQNIGERLQFGLQAERLLNENAL